MCRTAFVTSDQPHAYMRLFKQSYLLIIFCLLGCQVQAQTLTEEYLQRSFPPQLMRAEGVASVSVYESRQDSGAAPSKGRTIRIAKGKAEMIVFNRLGLPVKRLTYGSDEHVGNEIQMTYDAAMRLTDRTSRSFYPPEGFPPGADLTHHESTTHYTYAGDLLQMERMTAIPHGRLLEATTYSYGTDGRLKTERLSYNGGEENAVRTYYYEGNTVRMEEYNNDTLSRTKHTELDTAGRILSRAYTLAGEAAYLKEIYTYDAHGRLEEVRYQYADVYEGANSKEFSIQNRYDAHGKLIESIFDHGDGSKTIEWYVYEHWDGDK
jgi:hypothetical protein